MVRRCEDNHVVVLSNLKKETLFLWNQQVLLVAALQMIGFIFTNVTRIYQIMPMCKLCMQERFQFRQCWKGSERESNTKKRVNCEQGDKGKQCWEMASTAAKRIAWTLHWKTRLNFDKYGLCRSWKYCWLYWIVSSRLWSELAHLKR